MSSTSISTPQQQDNETNHSESTTQQVVIPSNLTLTTTTITGNTVTTSSAVHSSGSGSGSNLSIGSGNTSGIKVIAPSTMNLNQSTTTTNTTTPPTTPTTNSSSTTPPLQNNNSNNTLNSSNNSNNTTAPTSLTNSSVTPSSPSVSRQAISSSTTSTLSASITLPPSLSSSTSGAASASSMVGGQISTNGTHLEFQKAMENKKTLKKILKVSKHWSESVKVYCGNASSFSEELIKQSEQLSNPKKENHLNVALLSFGHTLKAVNSVNDQMLNEVQDVFCTPLNNFVDYDFAEVVESNKRVTKAKDDYDQSLAKISSSIKKSKTGIDEGRLFLYEQELERLRETFEGSNKELEIKLAELAHKNETKYLKSLILFINSQYHFYNRASKLFANLKPKLDDIEKYLEEIQPPKVVEGHLMKKSKQVMGGWNKCWYVLKDGMLYCYKGKKEFHPENALNILLCSVRVPQNLMSTPLAVQQAKDKEKEASSTKSEKDKEKELANLAQLEFRFEILHPRKKQPIVLQAENDEERDRWVQAIQDAISNSLNCQAIENNRGTSSYSLLNKSFSTHMGGSHGNATNMHGSTSGSGVQTDEVNQQVLRILQKVGGNTSCADCNQPDPDWASINLGIVICKVCSGVHRSLGTHISKVRSLTLDKWSPENILFMKEVGNTRFNLLFEHHTSPDQQPKPTPTSDRMAKENWIRAKYKNKEFIIKSTLSQEELSKTMQKNIQDGKKDVLTYIKLLAQGADINYAGGDDGRTPLHQSILKGDDVLIPEILLQNGADITLVDPRGWTPMHYAAFFNRARCANQLMKRGFESIKGKCRDHLSRLAVDLASLNRSKEVESILRGEEIDTGLNMDNIENNSIPVYESTIPISIDFPAIHQEILSDDDDEIDPLEQSQADHIEITSWSENESVGRSSFSDTTSVNVIVDNNNNNNNSNNTSATTTTTNNNNLTPPTLTTTHILTSSSNSNSSSSLITNNSSTGNMSNSLGTWVTGSQPNSSNSLGDDITNNGNTEQQAQSSGEPVTAVDGKKQKVDKNTDGNSKDYKGSRPKSKRRPSILGKGKNTLRLMRGKWGKKDSDSEDSESESEELADCAKDSPPLQNESSADNQINKSSTNLLATSTNNSNSLSSKQQQQQQQDTTTTTQPIQQTTPDKQTTTPASIEQSPQTTPVLTSQSSTSSLTYNQSSSSLHGDEQLSSLQSSQIDEKSPSKSSKEGSPTPFKMFLKKLKINKKKDGNDKGTTKRDSSVEDIVELNDVPDNVSVGTNDDSLIESDSSNSYQSNSSGNKQDKKKSKSKNSKQPVIDQTQQQQQEVINNE